MTDNEIDRERWHRGIEPEQAHTPTDDEREALSEFLFTVYEHGSQPNALREADAILSFLRARRTVQGEPSDAAVKAGLDAYFKCDFYADYPNSVRHHEPSMRRALRAAAAAQGESR